MRKGLVVHALSSSYNVSSLELRKERSNGAFVSSTKLYSIRSVYIMRVYTDNVVSKFWFVRSFPSQHHSKLITNITSENVSPVRFKEYKTRSFNRKVNLNFLISRHSNCDTAFVVAVSFLNESVHN